MNDIPVLHTHNLLIISVGFRHVCNDEQLPQTNFRHVRVKSMRRVFAHPHLFLIGEGLVDFPNTLKVASLSAEPAPPDVSFVVAAFEVTLDDPQREAFIRREPEYKITTTPFYAIDDEDGSEAIGEGVICLASTDTDIDHITKPESIETVWNWPHDSGLLPFSLYLRHCLLAVEKAGGAAHESFLKDTYLVDRKTTLAEYLDEHGEEVMSSRPPPHLKNRFSG